MIHHDDSMHLRRTRHNSHSKEVHQHKVSMLPRALPSDSDSPRTCRSLRVPGGQVVMRSKCTASHKVRSMVQGQACSQVRYNMVKKCKRRRHKGSRHSSTSNTAPTWYMVWRSHKRRSRHTSRSHNLDHGRVVHLRHLAHNSGCHRRLNTTSQDSLVRLAHLHPNFLHHKYLRSISSNPRPTHNPALRQPTLIRIP